MEGNALEEIDQEVTSIQNNNDDMINSVHNVRFGHRRLRRTWLVLKKCDPGHKIKRNIMKDY